LFPSLHFLREGLEKSWNNVFSNLNYIKVKDEKKTKSQLITEIKKLKRENKSLKESHIQMRNLTARLQKLREEEKVKMRYGVREDFGQLLSVLRMDLMWLDKKLRNRKSKESEKIISMIELIDTMDKDVQKVSDELRPSFLDHLSVNIAVKYYIEEFQKRTGIKCKKIFEPEEIVLSKNLSITLYRVIEEVLDNIEKHAKASNVKIKLKLNKDKLAVCITDDGIGIQEDKINDMRSLGLLGIKERLQPFDGNVIIRGFLNKGTKVVMNIPMKKAGI
jgi:signal transduction histidine kinase